MRALFAAVLLTSIAGTVSAADTLAADSAAPTAPMASVADSAPKAQANLFDTGKILVAPKPQDTATSAPKPMVPAAPAAQPVAASVNDAPSPAPMCPRMHMPMDRPGCPRMSMEDPDCCTAMDPQTWGIGARVLGPTSELLLHFPVAPVVEIAVRAGWKSNTTSENDPWVLSRYRQEEVTTAGDTFVTNQDLTGSGHLEATDNRVGLSFQVLADIPRGKGVDLLYGAGPKLGFAWSDSTNSTDGVSRDTVPLHLNSTSSTWSFSAGLLASLGARWWFVPGRLALVAELQAGVDWSYTSRSSDESTIRRVEYQNPVGINYYEVQANGNRSTSRSSWWSVSTSTATCSIGIDAFF